MKISLCVPLENLQTANGFGQASFQIVSSLQRLGHEVSLHDPTAPVELAFSQPTYWQWSSKDSYKIGYVPWESTEMPPMWKYMLRTADELWTPSQNMANWFGDLGYTFKVYRHGVDPKVWSPVDRANRTGPVKLLHIGEPAVRKGARLTLDTFTGVFGHNDEATLTIKSNGPTAIRSNFTNVTIIEEEYTEEQLVKLVHDHDVLIYPSYGEGFGLIPLQAMSTGMPVIITAGWAPYEDHLSENSLVKTTLGPSPWPKIHPGQMLIPDFEDLADAMEWSVNSFDVALKRASSKGILSDLHHIYDWDRLTAEAFAPIVARFDS